MEDENGKKRREVSDGRGSGGGNQEERERDGSGDNDAGVRRIRAIQDGFDASSGNETGEAKVGEAPEEEVKRPDVCEYTVGLIFVHVGCGSSAIADPAIIPHALQNAAFEVSCPKCKERVALRPKQQMVMVPQAQPTMALPRNRKEMRAAKALFGPGGKQVR